MGLLDDAIREHLDLKRRRGADPLEVERDEREALGPVRRAPEAPPSDEPSEAIARRRRSPTTRSATRTVGVTTPSMTSRMTPIWSDERRGAGRRRSSAPTCPSSSPRRDGEPTPNTKPRRPHHHSGDETIEYDVEDALGSEHHDAERRAKRRRRARGDAGVPPGHARPRPTVVRAASAEGLRLRRLGRRPPRGTPGALGARRAKLTQTRAGFAIDGPVCS